MSAWVFSMNSLRRSPHGERGLKFVLLVDGLRGLGRSPHGERGLKCRRWLD